MPRSLLCVFRSFAPQGDDGVLFRGDTRRDEAREECQQHTDRHEDNSSPGRESGHAAQPAQMADDRIERQNEQQCDADADGACRKADGQRLGVEDAEMSRREAPMERRTPISRVRSSTEI